MLARWSLLYPMLDHQTQARRWIPLTSAAMMPVFCECPPLYATVVCAAAVVWWERAIQAMAAQMPAIAEVDRAMVQLSVDQLEVLLWLGSLRIR